MPNGVRTRRRGCSSRRRTVTSRFRPIKKASKRPAAEVATEVATEVAEEVAAEVAEEVAAWSNRRTRVRSPPSRSLKPLRHVAGTPENAQSFRLA